MTDQGIDYLAELIKEIEEYEEKITTFDESLTSDTESEIRSLSSEILVFPEIPKITRSSNFFDNREFKCFY